MGDAGGGKQRVLTKLVPVSAMTCKQYRHVEC